MLRKSSLTVLALSALVSLAPCSAQNEITNNQPVVGSLNKTETRIQSKMTTDYHKGWINSDQLAQFQRDFDGILDKENVYQASRDGMTAERKAKILAELAAFEAKLDKQASFNMPAVGADQTQSK